MECLVVRMGAWGRSSFSVSGEGTDLSEGSVLAGTSIGKGAALARRAYGRHNGSMSKARLVSTQRRTRSSRTRSRKHEKTERATKVSGIPAHGCDDGQTRRITNLMTAMMSYSLQGRKRRGERLWLSLRA